MLFYRIHTLTSDDKRAVGAAVFVMGKARVAIRDCLIDSAGGFGVWVKHGGRVEVSDTTFLSAGEGRGVRGGEVCSKYTV